MALKSAAVLWLEVQAGNAIKVNNDELVELMDSHHVFTTVEQQPLSLAVLVPEDAAALLKGMDYRYEVTSEDGSTCAVIKDGELPSGNDISCRDLLIRLPGGFLDVATDIWWPPILGGGRMRPNADQAEAHVRRGEQRWKRERRW